MDSTDFEAEDHVEVRHFKIRRGLLDLNFIGLAKARQPN